MATKMSFLDAVIAGKPMATLVRLAGGTYEEPSKAKATDKKNPKKRKADPIPLPEPKRTKKQQEDDTILLSDDESEEELLDLENEEADDPDQPEAWDQDPQPEPNKNDSKETSTTPLGGANWRDLPPTVPPAPFVSTLLPHQAKGLTFMLQHARGIVADDMGLGKTPLAIAYLVRLHFSRIGHQPYLVVAPNALVQHWLDEFNKHAPTLRVKPFRPTQQEKYATWDTFTRDTDVVVTSKDTLAAECKRVYQWKTLNKGMNNIVVSHRAEPLATSSTRPFLFDPKALWGAVVHDEFHLRLAHWFTNTAFAARLLRLVPDAPIWGLTGTPVQNNLSELICFGSILRLGEQFNIPPRMSGNSMIYHGSGSDGKRSFATALKNDAHLLVLQRMIRRTKEEKLLGKPLVSLPPLQRIQNACAMSKPHQDIYEAVNKLLQEQFQRVEEKAAKNNNQRLVGAALLVALVRMRQACIHPLLPVVSAGATLQEATNLWNMARDPRQANSDAFQRAMNKACRNTLEGTNLDDDTSPSKRNQLRQKRIARTMRAFTPDLCTQEASSVLHKLANDVANAVAQGHKVVVMSSFVQGLLLAKRYLLLAKLQTDSMTEFTGLQNAKETQEALQRFKNDPTCKILLATTQKGGVGLNLAHAAHIFLLDAQWNPTADAQAIDRIHRIGQAHPTPFAHSYDATPYDYTTLPNGTVALKIRTRQEEKLNQAASVLGPDYCTAIRPNQGHSWNKLLGASSATKSNKQNILQALDW